MKCQKSLGIKKKKKKLPFYLYKKLLTDVIGLIEWFIYLNYLMRLKSRDFLREYASAFSLKKKNSRYDNKNFWF